MGIRTCKRCRQHVLSKRSPVKTLLNSEFQSAVNWLARRTDKKTGNKIGRIEEAEAVVKFEKDTFSLYGHTRNGQTVNINDVRGDAVFLRRFPDGKMDMADHFLFCLGGGQYILTDWVTVCTTINLLVHDHGSVIYEDCYRVDKDKFILLLKTAASDKI